MAKQNPQPRYEEQERASGGFGKVILAVVMFGIAAMLLGGTFVGMLSSALGEILQVVPVMTHRLHLSGRPFGFRLAMMAGKGIGAVLAGLMFTM